MRWNVEIWFASISFLHLQLQFKMIVLKFLFRFIFCSALLFISQPSLSRHKQEFNEKIISDVSFFLLFLLQNEIAGKTEAF